MRLLFVTRRYWPSVGGIEAYVRHVARALSERHTVTVLVAEPEDPETRAFRDGDVAVIPLRLTASRRALQAPVSLSRAPLLRRYAYGRSRHLTSSVFARAVAPVVAAADPRADLVHMWGGDMLGAAALRAARSLGVPYVTTPFAHAGQWGDDAASAMTYRAADRVVALLEADADVHRRLGVADSRIEVHGVCSPGVAARGGEELRRRHGIDGPLVLFLGVRRGYKGADLLLAAAPLVAARQPGITFAFVGPGELPSCDGTARIVDAGQVDEDERAAWLDAADLLCLPSAGEIFPNTFLEAWSASTPVLGSDIPALAELVTASSGGVVAPRRAQPIAQAIVALLDDPGRLRALGRSGRAFWQSRFTVEAITGGYEHMYENLLREGRTACAA